MTTPDEGQFGRELARLSELTRAGVQWMPLSLDDDGQPTSLFGMRLWPVGYADAVRILDPANVMAMRVTHEGGIVWQREGTLDDVVDGLLDLPDPDAHGAPRLVIGYAPTELRDIG